MSARTSTVFVLFLTFNNFKGKEAECTADLRTVIVVAAQLEVIREHAAGTEEQTHAQMNVCMVPTFHLLWSKTTFPVICSPAA